MQTRWFWVGAYYLSINFAIECPDWGSPLNLRVFCFDLAIRPLSAFHIASTWSAVGCCGNFVALFATFGNSHFHPDHLEFNPGEPYNASNRVSFSDFVGGYANR